MTDSTASFPALGICLEGYPYPYPVSVLPVHNDLQSLTMAYMDIAPSAEPNGKTVVLMHGKAFGGYYEELALRHRRFTPITPLCSGATQQLVPHQSTFTL